ncbi:MAG: NAD-dependent deacylase [Chloroflexota bacterium]
MELKGQSFEGLVERAAGLIVAAKRVVAFTGAGVSTESGIPDFRSPGGIWSKYDPEDFTIQSFVRRPDTRLRVWQMLAESGLSARAQPNAAHYAIAELERMGKLTCVITQNVDNLHQIAGSSPDRVFELHGNMQWARCLDCEKRYPMEEIAEKARAGPEAPLCTVCGGMLKPDAVFFGETLPSEALMKATSYSRNCDVFIVIGSTLVVYPAALMPQYAREAGAKLVIVNLSSTPMDHQASVLLRSKAGESMSRIAESVKAKLGR